MRTKVEDLEGGRKLLDRVEALEKLVEELRAELDGKKKPKDG
jgi:hypothetical protein